MRYMLDANAFILLLVGHPDVVARAAECEADDLVVSAIAFGEVAHGSLNSKPPALQTLRRAVSRIAVLPFDQAAAEAYAGLPFKRGSYDQLIAAHAIALDLTLVTANIGDFARIPHLRFEAWTK